jgi:RHS repeat-associated protein
MNGSAGPEDATGPSGTAGPGSSGQAGAGADAGSAAPAPPVIQVPRGGGAIRGIGEKFGTNPVTGTGSLTVPIAASPGRNGFGPRLQLRYDSGAGNGPFGFGWTIDLPRVTRKTDKGLPGYEEDAGPGNEESDVFILSDAEDLVPVPGDRIAEGYAVRRYHPRVEGLFARIERWTQLTTGEIHWRSVSRSNVLTRYGTTADSRIADPADPQGRIFSWLISESHDDKGNAIVYSYVAEDARNVDTELLSERNRVRTANRYPKTIRYGNRRPARDPGTWRPVAPASPGGRDWHFELVFDYGEDYIEEARDDAGYPDGGHVRVGTTPGRGGWPARPDPFSTCRSGFEVRTYRRCHRVLMFHLFDELGGEPCLVRSTDFDYADLDYSRPVSPEAEAAWDGSTRLASVLRTITQAGYVRDPARPAGRRDGRGYLTYLRRALPPVELSYSKAVIDATVRQLDRVGQGVDPTGFRWADLDGVGAAGILTQQAGAWFYRENQGSGRFGPVTTLPAQPDLPALGDQGGPLLIDVSGNGRLHAVTLDGPVPGFYERTQDRSWRSLVPFAELPEIDWDDPNLRLVDITGDGLSDVLITEDDAFSWHRSLGTRGFGPASRTAQSLSEQTGPRLMLADPDQSIYLADMSGDGLSDLVRVRNGEVCYWPSLGYGRFGAKVTMDNSPWFESPDLFDQQRVRLADVDGTGASDIVYLAEAGPAIYANQSGNSFRDPVVLAGFPRVDDLALVSLTDLLGTGTVCLVWSSALPQDATRPVRYVDLMAEGKPYLLTTTVNNLGAQTRIEYRTSTQFCLADEAAGRPWSTLLPFPVHVVERVQTYDLVSDSRIVTRYAYHDGYYDGVEREFRGFGLVDRWDTESFAALADSGGLPAGSNIRADSHLPPVHTRSRFHIGRREDGGILPPGLSPEEEREGYRAMKGSLLRQEVFGRDGTAREDQPYLLTEQRYQVRLVQHKGSNLHAVFFPHGRESVSYHYERQTGDPRIRHELTIKVDDFGNILRYAGVGYGREHPDPRLDPADQEVQGTDLIVFTENEVTNLVDSGGAYRLPLPSESRTYELTGLARRPGELFTHEQIGEAITAAAARGYTEPPQPGRRQRRLIEHLRTRYRRDDLSGPLPPGVLEPLALPYEQYRLAFTRGLLDAVYGDRVTSDMLARDGRYRRDEHGWWMPSGQMFYSAEPAEPADELAHARQHFFLPRRYLNPFGAKTVITYDHDLLLAETRDALGNRTTVGERNIDPQLPLVRGGQDYRVLQPWLVMDPNRNQTAVAFDALGLVVGTALMGAPELDPVPGDRLTRAFQRDLTREQIARFAADPRGQAAAELLGEATTRIVYDLTASPAFAATIARYTHVSDLAPGERSGLRVTISYCDGFHRQIQQKVQAEPGREGERRWLATGWTVFNNKGKPVRRYEPFFSRSHRFEPGTRHGVSVILGYDPLERVVATLHPDHTWEKVDLGPWSRVTWDGTDTVLAADPRVDPVVGGLLAAVDPGDMLPTWYQRRIGGELGRYEQEAAVKAAANAGTPTAAHSDPLGRAFLTVAHNRSQGTDEFLATRVVLDVENNQRAIRDPAGRTALRYDYSIAGSRVHQASMEAGEQWTLPDVAGRQVYTWNSRGQRVRTVYDELRRPARQFLREGAGPEALVGHNIYGEQEPDPVARNLRTKLVRCYDQAGIAVSDRYDFKGNQIRSARRLARSFRDTLDWDTDVPVEERNYAGHSRFDALNRLIEVTEPDGTVIRPHYNEADLLERLHARLRGSDEVTAFVDWVGYDAKGLRTEIRYGNGVRTSYERDPQTFRLMRLRTRRGHGDLQDLGYTYDPCGNVTHVADRAQQAVFFRGRRVDPSAGYTYDALYRLTEATGREHLGQAGRPYGPSDQWRQVLLHAQDGPALARYTERYDYDAAGNVLSMRHRSADPARPGWTRRFTYAEPSLLEPDRPSNRLTRCTVGSVTEVYSDDGDGYDPQGGLLHLPSLGRLAWDYKNQLRMTAHHASAGERTWYVYDGAGQRVRKVTEHPDGAVKDERVYAGSFEVYRRAGPSGITRETLSVMDDRQRVALVETLTEGHDRGPDQLIRYQHADPLCSVLLEVDQQDRIITYEEYAPYGSTTLQAVRSQTETPKRYRFTGKERDEETGFSYHGARYYVPWLARWTTCDPAGPVDGPNLYCYVSGRPTHAMDPSGTQGDSNDIAMGMMWDRMGAELSGMIESVFGGHAYVNPRTNTADYSGPEGGVGGVIGGVVRAGTLRLVPIEQNATDASLIGMEVGGGLVPVLDPGARLVTGNTVTGQDASRGWAAVQLGLDVLPFAADLHAATMGARGASIESRVITTDVELLGNEGKLMELDYGHIGAGTGRPTVTNPTANGYLCVADVGAHQANLRNPDLPAITNTEFVEASGQSVSQVEAPIKNAGEATNFLNEGFAGLYEQGRIESPINASIPAGPLEPGEYLAVVDGPTGGHALHATVTDEVMGTKWISDGKLVTASDAQDIIAEGGKATPVNVYRIEYYDPQQGVCVQPASAPSAYIKLE